jgi:hypothetical protein
MGDPERVPVEIFDRNHVDRAIQILQSGMDHQDPFTGSEGI